MVLLDSMKLLVSLIFILFSFNSVQSQDRFENLDVFELQYARDPQISPDGNYILYVRTEMDIMKDGRSFSIWILNAYGTNHQKLTTSTRNESNPRWSPDSKKISFISSSDDDNGSEIFIYWVHSKQYSSISQLSGSPRSIKWSRNGKYLGFSIFVP